MVLTVDAEAVAAGWCKEGCRIIQGCGRCLALLGSEVAPAVGRMDGRLKIKRYEKLRCCPCALDVPAWGAVLAGTCAAVLESLMLESLMCMDYLAMMLYSMLSCIYVIKRGIRRRIGGCASYCIQASSRS